MSRTSSEQLMSVQFTPCVQGEPREIETTFCFGSSYVWYLTILTINQHSLLFLLPTKLPQNIYVGVYSTQDSDPVGNCMLKVNNRNTRTMCEISSKLTIKTPERRHWRRLGVFINFEHIWHLVLVFLLSTLSR